ncbi:MAG: hypothetical protein LWW81_13990 [Rhodocyclales bacterium]|nr:hypothetical protein [Rhodocyclales bacterium]
MSEHLFQTMSQSASDFINITWPVVSNFPLIGGGSIKPVEAVTTNDFKDELDLLAGIDAWQINVETPMIRGMASRIQWRSRYDTFSIRFKLPSGQPTEFDKRKISIANKQYGHLFPHITVQAYLSEPGGGLLSCAAITTENLFEVAARLVDGGGLDANRNPSLYGTQVLHDGTTFIYLSWRYLAHLGKLDMADVFAPDA